MVSPQIAFTYYVCSFFVFGCRLFSTSLRLIEQAHNLFLYFIDIYILICCLLLLLIYPLFSCVIYCFFSHRSIRRVIFQDFSWFQDFCKSPFASKCSRKKRSSHRGKKEVVCIVSKPLVSCLWGCGESVNPPKLNIQGGSGGLCPLEPKRDPGPLPVFQDFLYFCQIIPPELLKSMWHCIEWIVTQK